MKKILICLALMLACGCSNSENLPQEPVHEELVEVEIQDTPPQPTKKVVTITAAGDCTLATDANAPQDKSFVWEVENQGNDYSYFFRNVKDIFSEDDLTIINFEGTLSERGSRQSKQFAFRGKPEYTEILTSSSVEAANLSNNHSSDYGAESKEDTITHLNNAGVLTFSGTDVCVTEVKGVKVGLVGVYCLNEKGAAELEPSMNAVKEQGAELIIVNCHWGKESAKTPNSDQIEIAHKAVDLGADLVVGHHPHVLQGIEKYNGKYIVYSLGNFCFGGNRNPSDKDTMIFRQTFTISEGEPEDDDNILIIPCAVSSVSDRNNYQPTPLDGDEATRVMEKISERSAAISE